MAVPRDREKKQRPMAMHSRRCKGKPDKEMDWVHEHVNVAGYKK